MNTQFEELYRGDMSRYKECNRYTRKLIYCLRKCQTVRNPLLKLFFRYKFKRLKSKHGLEIYYDTKIGKGLYLGHPYNITINASAVIGENCNIHKGVTIGQENRGVRKGSPVIGDCVWIGINAAIVGNIKIGSDVLIAPNSYVNCDVPDHSVVFGNPCIIKHRDNATEDYINNKVKENIE